MHQVWQGAGQRLQAPSDPRSHLEGAGFGLHLHPEGADLNLCLHAEGAALDVSFASGRR